MVQLQRLEGFYWVARTGGYAKAARAFPYPITQPAVHQQVKKLEGELGVALFERVGKDRMQLTAAGSRLYRFVSPFFEQMPGLVRSLKSGDYAGMLRIHAAPMMLRQLLPAWIKRIQKLRPGIHIELREMAIPDVQILRNGDTDLLVDHLPEVAADIATLRVATLRAFLVLPAGHALLRKKRLTLEECAQETFISYSPGTLACELQMKAFAVHGAVPRSTLSAGTTETILGFVESGLGYSLVPSLDPQGPRGRGLEARLLSAPKVEFPVYAAWRKDTPENPLLDAALESAPTP
jgi:LysR family transcriptional regulator, benzoate and cis,cis-muconate-responsive activator of ben and cat genes